MSEKLIDIAELSPFSHQVAALDWILLFLLYSTSGALYLSAHRPGWWRVHRQGAKRNVYRLAAKKVTELTTQSKLTAEQLHQAVAVTRHALVLSVGNFVKGSSSSELRHLVTEGVIDAAYNDLCATLGELDDLRFTSSPDLERGAQLLSRLQEELRNLGRQRALLVEHKE